MSVHVFWNRLNLLQKLSIVPFYRNELNKFIIMGAKGFYLALSLLQKHFLAKNVRNMP